MEGHPKGSDVIKTKGEETFKERVSLVQLYKGTLSNKNQHTYDISSSGDLMTSKKGDHMNSVERENEGGTVGDIYRSENILDH